MTYQIEVLSAAREQLHAIRDRRVLQKIRDRIDALKTDPDKQGEPLRRELIGYRAVRAVGQRYRIIYRVIEDRVVVIVFWLGRRRQGSPDDVYQQATRLVRKTRRARKP